MGAIVLIGATGRPPELDGLSQVLVIFHIEYGDVIILNSLAAKNNCFYSIPQPQVFVVAFTYKFAV